MYRSSAALTRNICRQVRHPQGPHPHRRPHEVPGADHTDPGPNWNWTTYMNYVTGGGGTPSWTTTVDNATAGQFTASANWGTSSLLHPALRRGLPVRRPGRRQRPGLVPGDHPSAGTYRVEVWYPADPGYNSSAPYIVAATGGNQTVYVDQRSGGGSLAHLGTFSLNAGDPQRRGRQPLDLRHRLRHRGRLPSASARSEDLVRPVPGRAGRTLSAAAK